MLFIWQLANIKNENSSLKIQFSVACKRKSKAKLYWVYLIKQSHCQLHLWSHVPVLIDWLLAGSLMPIILLSSFWHLMFIFESQVCLRFKYSFKRWCPIKSDSSPEVEEALPNSHTLHSLIQAENLQNGGHDVLLCD